MEVPCETNARFYLILDRDRHVAHALDRSGFLAFCIIVLCLLLGYYLFCGC